MARGSTSSPFTIGVAIGLLAFGAAGSIARAATHDFKVTVVHASKSGHEIHPSLREIAASLRELSEERGVGFEFESLVPKDEVVFKLAVGSSGRMQLPNGKWMTLAVEGHDLKKGMLKIAIAVEKLGFETTVSIATGATAVLPGPDYQDGRLILVITRLPAAKS